MAEQVIRAGLIVTVTRADGPRIDPEEVADALVDELPDELWVDETSYALDWELDLSAIRSGTTRVDL